jgi:hypothetical protein
LQNFKSVNGGTAYLSNTLSVKVDDRDIFLDFIRANEAWEFLDARPYKDPVKEWIAANPTHSTAIIGLTTEWIVKCNIRNS